MVLEYNVPRAYDTITGAIRRETGSVCTLNGICRLESSKRSICDTILVSISAMYRF